MSSNSNTQTRHRPPYSNGLTDVLAIAGSSLEFTRDQLEIGWSFSLESAVQTVLWTSISAMSGVALGASATVLALIFTLQASPRLQIIRKNYGHQLLNEMSGDLIRLALSAVTPLFALALDGSGHQDAAQALTVGSVVLGLGAVMHFSRTVYGVLRVSINDEVERESTRDSRAA